MSDREVMYRMVASYVHEAFPDAPDSEVDELTRRVLSALPATPCKDEPEQ